MSSSEIPLSLELTLHDQLNELLYRFGGVIEFWTVVCISRESFGDPNAFINAQWEELFNAVQELRIRINEIPNPPSSVHNQLQGLISSCTELRSLFDSLQEGIWIPRSELELTVHRLRNWWAEVRLRVALLSVCIPLLPPLPSLDNEQENYYQGILDSILDRFLSMQSGQVQHWNSKGNPSYQGSISAKTPILGESL